MGNAIRQVRSAATHGQRARVRPTSSERNATAAATAPTYYYALRENRGDARSRVVRFHDGSEPRRLTAVSLVTFDVRGLTEVGWLAGSLRRDERLCIIFRQQLRRSTATAAATAIALDVDEGRMVEEKPCRTCTDFKTWAAIQKKTFDSEKSAGKRETGEERGGNAVTAGSERVRDDCPLDKDELGSKTWAFLHTMAAYYPETPSTAQKADMTTFFDVFSKFYPCNTCAEDFREQLRKTPARTDSRYRLGQWLCEMHNEVNKKVGKPVFDCALVNQRWRDGWRDGSCD